MIVENTVERHGSSPLNLSIIQRESAAKETKKNSALIP